MSATRAFKIQGLDCAEEVAILKRTVGPLVGGEERLRFDILAGRMSVPVEADARGVVAAVAATGMKAELWAAEGHGHDHGPGGDRFLRNLATIFSGIFTVTGFVQHAMWAGGFGAAFTAGEGAP